MLKRLTITAITLKKDHADLCADGYTNGEVPAEYSYINFRIPLSDLPLYRVGQRIAASIDLMVDQVCDVVDKASV